MAKSFIQKTFNILFAPLTWVLFVAVLIAYISPFISPEDVWWLAFFGLAYPIILFFLVLFMVINFFINKKRFFVLLVLFLIGIPLHLRMFAFGSSTGELPENSIQIMSYNVRQFDRYEILGKNKEMKDEIIKFIAREKPDVLCFQEYYQSKEDNKFMGVNEIKDKLNYKYHKFNTAFETVKGNFGVSIYSKFKIINSGSLKLDNKTNFFNLYTDLLTTEGDTLRVYTVHFESIRLEKESYALFDSDLQSIMDKKDIIYSTIKKIKNAHPLRIKQVNLILEHAKNSPYPAVICGDFNDPPISHTYQLFRSQFLDAFNIAGRGVGRTFIGKIPAGRIDYIFHSPQLSTLKFKIQEEKLSDHYAIQAWLKLSN